MKLRLRIGRQQTKADEAGGLAGSASAQVPSPRTPDRRVVRVGSYCRAGDIGQAAVTRSGRAVVAVSAGHCGRWVYAAPA